MGAEWMGRAACREPWVDPEVFFPIAAPGTADYDREVREARRVCAGCPVSGDCLEFAVAEGIGAGVFAGTTPAERAAYARARRAG